MQNPLLIETSFTLESDTPWHAIYTWHQHEKMVADLLSRKGFEIFLPLYQSTRRWKDRLKTLSLPLFPSYVFIRGGMDQHLQIVTTPGVSSLLTVSGRVAEISRDEIDAVKRTVESSLRAEPHPFLKCGDWVRVKAGPLEGIEGILVRMKGMFRLVISVELLQKSVAVEVDSAMVERARCPYPTPIGNIPGNIALRVSTTANLAAAAR